MMARYFYAFRWAYGIGATWDDGSWPGELYVFESRAERDAWVADDVFDGNWHREAITAREARHIMADTVIGFDNEMIARFDGSLSAVERYAPTVELVEAWAAYRHAKQSGRILRGVIAVIDHWGRGYMVRVRR